METPDKAAGLADSKMADAINKEWLVASAQSSQLSMDLKRFKLEFSLESANSVEPNLYGSTVSQPVSGQMTTTSASSNEFTWLKAHYKFSGKRSSVGKKSNPGATYTINGHLYDNISFADSPILRSLSRRGGTIQQRTDAGSGGGGSPIKNDYDSVYCNDISEGLLTQRGCYFDKFRIFLACYVLLGITFAIYSRNALSLAAVGMVASNVLNRDLVKILSSGTTISNLTEQIYSALDGSCPVYGLAPTTTTSDLNLAQVFGHNNRSWTPLVNQPSEQAKKSQLETRFRMSIKQRVERGDLVDWSPSEQGMIFAAGSVGNLLIAIPLTRLGEIYGPKWIIFAASLGATIQAALMPLISPHKVGLIILFQIIFNGLTFGADCVAYTWFAYWLTPTELAFFVSCLLVCYQLGTMISSFITSKILSSGLAWSWCFYTPAILCGLWTIVWAIIGASEPSKSSIISRKELLFLLKHSKIPLSLNNQATSQTNQTNVDENLKSYEQSTISGRDKCNQQQEQPHAALSWLKMAKDPNIWAIIAVKFTLRWYFSVYLSLMPTYLSSVAHMSVSTIGKVGVCQSFISLALGILMGYMTKSLVSRRPFDLSLATTRKIFQSIVNFGLAVSLAIFIIYDCNQWVTIVTLTLGGICINFYCAAALQLPLDLSPNHCGLITSITNTLALGQTLGAPISGLILNGNPKDRGSWRIVWAAAIAMNALSGLIFILLVDSKPRDYNKYQEPRLGCEMSAASAPDYKGPKSGSTISNNCHMH